MTHFDSAHPGSINAEQVQCVEAIAPATIANLGPGFDILGLALAEPFDRVIAERTDAPGLQITQITGDGGRLSRDPTRNTAGVSALYVLRQLGIRAGVSMIIHKGLPLASGLGSSAASAVAGAMAINALFGDQLSRLQLLDACVEGEALVSGRHADNVAPALIGGIVLVMGVTAETVYPLPTPPGLILALVTPNVAVPTAQARAVLPKQVDLHLAVQQAAAVAHVVAALYTGDIPTLARAMEADKIIEPARAHLMPGLAAVRAAAARVGGLATVISGAGPTLCTVCPSEEIAQRVVDAMNDVYKSLNLACVTRVTRPSPNGATTRIIKPVAN